MRSEYDSYLIEESVFREMRRRETSGKREDYLAYRAKLDRIYEGPTRRDPEGMAEALRLEHMAWFKRLGFWRIIHDIFDEFPLLGSGIDLLSLQAAVRRRAESAELFVREDDTNAEKFVRTLVLSIYPESFMDLPRLRSFLRRELRHISDMLDPAFGYRPDLGGSACTAAQENLLRDRYAVLWGIYAEGRNLRAAPAESETSGQKDNGGDVPARLRALGERAFTGLPQAVIDDSLRRAWVGENITHDELVALAGASPGEEEAGTEGGQPASDGARCPPAGTPCPACGFPTHEWVPTDDGYSCLQCFEMLNLATPAK